MIGFADSSFGVSAPNFTVLAPIITGFIAVWYLLPTPRPRPLIFGGLFVVLALAGFGIYMQAGFTQELPISIEGILFTAFSLLAVTFSMLMITQRNPARSAIYFTVVVLSVCGLFLLLAAPFLMAATIIIYAGAIIVTFLFVLMLSQAKGYSDANDRTREPYLSTAIGFIVLASLLVGLQRVYDVRDINQVMAAAERYSKAELLDENLKNPKTADLFFQNVDTALKRLGYEVVDSSQQFGEPKKKAEEVRVALADLKIELDGTPDLSEVKLSCRRIYEGLSYLKALREGMIYPYTDVPLSPHGTSRPVVTDSDKKTPQANQLPAANIAALGRSLFTDHLIAIELAGTLLLVATIGAIAISSGRGEKAK